MRPEMKKIVTPLATRFTPVGPGGKLIDGFHWVDRVGHACQDNWGAVFQLTGDNWFVQFVGWYPVMDEATWRLGRAKRIALLLEGAVEIEGETPMPPPPPAPKKAKAKKTAVAAPEPCLF